MEKINHSKIVWVCKYCNWVVTSDSRQHHCMDFYQCNKCGVDLEYYMCRYSAPIPTKDIIILARFEKGKWRRARK